MSNHNLDVKKDDVLAATNYRPISVTTSVSKILERTSHRQMKTYVERNGILTPFQFGFSSGVSSQNAILYSFETLRHDIENCSLVHAVLVDLSETFD